VRTEWMMELHGYHLSISLEPKKNGYYFHVTYLKIKGAYAINP
jgi:hypothetical protein